VEDATDVPDASQVRVLWATDHAGKRHALTMSRAGTQVAVLTLWRGDAGASPAAMRVMAREPSGFSPDRPFVRSSLFQIRDGDDADGPGLFVATGTELMAVEAATGPAYDTAGRRTLTWAPLQPRGAVFVREATDAELDDMIVRGAAPDGRWFRMSGRSAWSTEVRVPDGLLDVSLPDVQPQALRCAVRRFAPLHGGFPDGSMPLLGATPRLGAAWVGLVVARAPDGAYLVGLCRTSQPDRTAETGNPEQGEGFVVPAPAGGERDLLILVPCERSGGMALVTAVCVIAPEGATEVEVGGVRAEVRDRLAVVSFPQPLPVDEVRATARRADGSVVGPVRRADGEEAVTAVALPEYRSRR
jgi:hypothetical protein